MLFLATDKIWVIIKLYICSDFLSGHKPKVSEGLILIYHDSYTVFVCLMLYVRWFTSTHHLLILSLQMLI